MRFYTSNNGDWGKVEENSGSWDGGRWRSAATGGGRRQWPAAVGVGAQPTQNEQGITEEGEQSNLGGEKGRRRRVRWLKWAAAEGRPSAAVQ